MTAPVVVIDNGTGVTKMGYAGNAEPTYVIPSVIAEPVGDSARGDGGVLADMRVHIGDEALAACAAGVEGAWRASSPIRCGLVEDWGKMEKLWLRSVYQYLRVEPEETGFLLSEPPANPPENRELAAEVMFETLGVRQLHIAPQGTLALRGVRGHEEDGTAERGCVTGLDGADTGLIIDGGAGATSITPIVGGCVFHHAIQHLPVSGRDITDFTLEKLRERGLPPESESARSVAERIKEKYGFVCRRLSSEAERLDGDLRGYGIRHRELSRRTGEYYSFDVAHERFLAPELLISPGMLAGGADGVGVLSLPEAVDAAVQACPMDCRRPLYRSVVLVGGSTLFPGLRRRLQDELRCIVDRRAGRRVDAAGTAAHGIADEVHVLAHPRRQFAVWRGGSMLGASPEYDTVAHTRQQYEEEGPRIMRERTLLHDAP